MKGLSDDAVARLKDAVERPDFAGTRYRVVGELGRGGMGLVYEAEDLVLDRRVAVKILPAELGSAADAERLRREAKTVAGLEHPGIVPVHDLGELADGRLFYAMKLVRGARLDTWARAEPLPERLRAFLRICEAVGFAHANGVVHRDLKPGNVMVGEFGAVLVMDWGLAEARRTSEPSDIVGGTPGYMAPEQERGAGAEPAADIYALGGILEFLVHAGGTKPPRALDAVWRRAKNEIPEERYATAAALADEISRFLDGETPRAYHAGPIERFGRFLGRHRALMTLIAAYVLMRAIVFLWFRR
jgi:serine/threonine protein kinase